MEYKYDPILCMNIPVEKSKVKDASWKAWTLYIDGKWVKSFTSEMAPIKEAQKFMKENYPGKVGKLVRNTGSTSGYSISGSESRDSISSIDEAIKSCDTNDKKVVRDGMFSKIFGEVTKGAEYKMKHGLSELGKITDSKQFEQVNQTYANELNKSLERLMNTYNVASQDYQNERNNIIDLINQFNKQSIQMYRKLIGK